MKRFATLAAVLQVLAIPAIASAVTYNFTNIAVQGPGIGIAPYATINSSGEVAFLSYEGAFYKGSGGPLTPIFVRQGDLQSRGQPVIRDDGSVAFVVENQRTRVQGIYTGSGGPLTLLIDSTGPYAQFIELDTNGAGKLAFRAIMDGQTFPNLLFTLEASTAIPVAMDGHGASVSPNGQIAFVRGRTVFRNDVNTPIYTPTSVFGEVGYHTDVNDAGEVVFLNAASNTLYRGSGGAPQVVADANGHLSGFAGIGPPFPPETEYTARFGINNAGTIAFHAGLDSGGNGIFATPGTGAFPVIQPGNPLFGSTLRAAEFGDINERGQIAFYYSLADGPVGIAVATPVPEPSGAALVIVAMSALAVRIRR